MIAALFILLATPSFPSVIQAQVGAGSPPRCSVCHATDAGGGPVVQRFGQYLVSRGLQPYDEASLRNALLADAGEHHSSGAGVPDLEALAAGLDPNGSTTAGPALTPTYGCSSGSGGWPAALAVGILFALRRHSRNRCATSRADRHP